MVSNFSSSLSNSSSSIRRTLKCDILDASLAVQIAQFVALSLTLLISLAGNILILLTLIKRQELRKTMNCFILNMAVSDLLYPLSIIPVRLIEIVTNSRHWHITGTAGLIFCKTIRYMEHLSISVSVQSLMWIALDRFMAVVLPLKAFLISLRFRITAILFSWIVAMISNSADLFSYGLVKDNHETRCDYLKSKTNWNFINGKAHIYIFHVLPVIALTISYGVVAVTLRKQDKMLGAARINTTNYQRKRRAIRMSFCIMAAFCICTVPLTAQNVIDLYEISVPCDVYRPLRFISYLIFYFSSAINPIICFAFVGKYADTLKNMFKLPLNSFLNRRSRTKNRKITDQGDGIVLQGLRVSLELTEI